MVLLPQQLVDLIVNIPHLVIRQADCEAEERGRSVSQSVSLLTTLSVCTVSSSFAQLTILDLGNLSTNLPQNISPPFFALAQVLDRAGQSGASLILGSAKGDAKLCRLRLAEAVEHRLSFFLIAGHGWRRYKEKR